MRLAHIAFAVAGGAETEGLRSLGATIDDEFEARWATFADPERNEFCVVREG